MQIHADVDASSPPARGPRWAFTTQATTSFADLAYADGDALLGRSSALAPEVLAHPRITGQLRIPMLPGR